MFERFRKNENADVKMVGAVIGILITIIIGALVFYSIAGSMTPGTTDTTLNANLGTGDHAYAANATGNTLEQAETFFTIAPIIAIVIVAVVILQYVGRIG